MSSAVDAAAPEAGGARLARPGADTVALPLVVIGLVALFSALPATRDTFPTLANVQVVLGNQAVLAVVGLAALVPLVGGQYDFSVGATAGLSTVMCGAALSGGTSVPLAAAIAIGVGIAVGTVNGVLIGRFGIEAVITTFGMATIVNGVIILKTGGATVVGGIPVGLTNFGAGNSFLGLPNLAWVVAGLGLVVAVLLTSTPAGFRLTLVGSNPPAARLVGVRLDRTLAAAFAAAGALAGLAGFLQVARAGSADPGVGASYTLQALTVAFLSATSVRPGRYNVAGLFVAILFLATLNSGLDLAGAPAYVHELIDGAALIAGVALAGALHLRRQGRLDR